MHNKKEIRESLNKNLIKIQKLNNSQISVIVDLHFSKEQILEEMELNSKLQHNYNPSKLKELANQITEIEFMLQTAWGFPQDKALHRFWELPGCCCQRLDNEDLYPSKYYWKSKGCPIHGKKLYKL